MRKVDVCRDNTEPFFNRLTLVKPPQRAKRDSFNLVRRILLKKEKKLSKSLLYLKVTDFPPLVKAAAVARSLLKDFSITLPFERGKLPTS